MLVLSSAFQMFFVTSSGPDILLFKRFHSQWNSIDQSVFQPGTTDEFLRQHLLSVSDDLMTFPKSQLEITHPREDYQEILELSTLFLRKAPPRGVHF